LFLVVFSMLILLVLPLWAKNETPASVPSTDSVPFLETFADAALHPETWVVTRKNDFSESTVDVVGTTPENRRLRLRAATLGTRETTVKYHGVRTCQPVVDLTAPSELAFDLDWNQQSNGCYLTAGVLLCPTATTGNPEDEPAWLKIEYLGVPPGRNGRCQITLKRQGRLTILFAEGWPDRRRSGRTLGLQRVQVVMDRTSLQVEENGTALYATSWCNADRRVCPLDWTRAYVYLQQSSHSNYPAREVFFDNIGIRGK
jgi:hypothetical protein